MGSRAMDVEVGDAEKKLKEGRSNVVKIVGWARGRAYEALEAWSVMPEGLCGFEPLLLSQASGFAGGF